VKSGDATVYLLGSVHIAKAEIYPLDPAIENAFDESGKLVVEMDVTQVDPMEMMKYATYKTGETLEDNLSEKNYKKISELFKENGVNSMVYNSLKPWMASMMLMQLELAKAGYEPNNGIDTYFLKKAYEAEKEILELETIEEQAKVFEAMDNASDEYMEYSLKDLKNTVSKMEEIFKAWQEGDAGEINELMNSEFDVEGGEKLEEVLLTNRNEKMTEKIKGYLSESGTYFVIVGAAHLAGEKGIVEMLKETGNYEIEQK
jgi:uncharacterized protein YbaP (TraB family)